jgi:hemerythrin-like domain-containing protein
MGRRGDRSNLLKWSLFGTGIAAGAALIPFIPAMRRRAMRVTTILKKDHRVVSGLVTGLEMTPKVNGILRRRLFDQIRTQVMLHSQAEEEILYPAMRNLTAATAESKVDDAYREHQVVKDLLQDLSTMDPMSEAFDRKFTDFKNNLNHHVEEEENDMFVTLVQSMSVGQQEALGQRIHDRKADLKHKMVA